MDKKERREIILWAVLPPLVLIGGYMLGAYGTLSPCAAVDQIISEQLWEELRPKNAIEYAAISLAPSYRRTVTNSPAKCFMALARHERDRFQGAVRPVLYPHLQDK